MNRKEYLAKLEEEIMYRKDPMIRCVEMELEKLQKYLEDLKKSDSVGDVINNARAVNFCAENIRNCSASNFGTINELRLGLFYLQGID